MCKTFVPSTQKVAHPTPKTFSFLCINIYAPMSSFNNIDATKIVDANCLLKSQFWGGIVNRKGNSLLRKV